MPETYSLSAGKNLDLSYDAYDTNDHGPLLGIIPGFGHTKEHFTGLAEELQSKGVATAVLNFRSANKNLIRRNMAGMDSYAAGIDRMIDDLRTKLGQITAICGHSMGGQVVQEWEQQQAEADKCPQILMAPVPLNGALKTVGQIARQNPGTLARMTAGFVSKNGQQLLNEKDVKKYFHTADTPDEVIQATQAALSHTPLRAFIDIALRSQLRPSMQSTTTPTQLIQGDKDALFPEQDLSDVYPNLEKVLINGGHDFFAEQPKETAEHITRFLNKKHS